MNTPFDFTDIPTSVLLDIQADLLDRVHQDAVKLAELNKVISYRCACKIATVSSFKRKEPAYGSDA